MLTVVLATPPASAIRQAGRFAGPAAERIGRLRAIRSWAFAIGSGDLRGDLTRRYRGYGLVVVDGQEAAPAQVQAARAGGSIVLGYLDVGTIERPRPWFAAARRYRLGRLPDWGEWYADVAQPGYRRLIARHVAPALARKGFDGLFLDNTDMVETHPRQRAGMARLARSLAALVHARGGLLFTQNGQEVIGPTLHLYDGWNREDVTSTYDFARRRYVPEPAVNRRAALAALRRIRRAGLLVTATDYVAAGDAATARAAIANACSAGALPFVSDIELSRLPPRPITCGG